MTEPTEPQQTTHKALISVWNKEGLVPFARELTERGWELVSSSGTARVLRDAGLTVTEVAELTGTPHILGGRVKTLHPAIAGGILARRDRREDQADLEAQGIEPIDMVVCNLYPFEAVAAEGHELDELLEHIDIGGVTLLRAAAKNYHQVAVVPSPQEYEPVLESIRECGAISLPLRERLALRAFRTTAAYDAVISGALETELGRPEAMGERLHLPLQRVQPLRYGENPHQQAGLYLPAGTELPWEQRAGKPLSFNNILDLDAVLRGTALLQEGPGAVVVKHTTPCGMATGATSLEAFEKAHAGDPVSAFGGIAGFTRTVDKETCRRLAEHFLEVVAAPGFDPRGEALLREKRPSLRLLTWRGGRVSTLDVRSTWSGYLVQEDRLPQPPTGSAEEWAGEPDGEAWADLLFAWKVCALCKSNAIVVARDGASLGIGAGFTSRVGAVEWALGQAGGAARGAVLASDAFFPFPDSVELAAEAGIRAIIQPGGSRKDDEVVAAADRLGVAMYLSGHRTFRH